MIDADVILSESTRAKLHELAEWSGRSAREELEQAFAEYCRASGAATPHGQPTPEELERAVEAFYRPRFWQAVDAGYAALRADPKAWAAEEEERRLWDATLLDGLDPREPWGDDGLPLPPDSRGRPA
jgi:hypothetical protein